MDYFHWVRREIKPLLPEHTSRVLEVGAGAGGTLKWLKTLYPHVETTAVEINPELLDELGRNVDVPVIGSIDTAISQLKTYDLILLLDVLEHLTDPSTTLQRLSKVLTPNGQIIVSLPNISHLSVSIPLLLKRRFEYEDAGILDRTHMRFFVEETAIKLLNDAGFLVTAGLTSGIHGLKSKALNFLSFGALRHHLTKQHIMLGQLADGSVSQNQVSWKTA
jgi:2-polyprenyl-3-methyl-5-hydroxy-6-metoxy-1,4-benzoquinol methylase